MQLQLSKLEKKARLDFGVDIIQEKSKYKKKVEKEKTKQIIMMTKEQVANYDDKHLHAKFSTS